MNPKLLSLLCLCALGASSGCQGSTDNAASETDDEIATALQAPVELRSGVPVSGVSGPTGDEKQFYVRVPQGATNLRFSISGDTTGNADLYVRYGQQATRIRFTYRSTLPGNNETIVVDPVRAGTWYVLVRAQAAYTNVTVAASFDATTDSGGTGGATSGGAPSSGGSPAMGGSTSTMGGSTGTTSGGTSAGGSASLDCSDPASWPSDWAAFEDRVIELVNVQRVQGATCGGMTMPPVAPLSMEAHLRVAARCHSLDMAVNAYFDHDGLDGGTPWQRIAAAGYGPASWQGENIAAGYATPEAVVSGWMSSTGHCTNIMGSHFVDSGVGYAYLSGSPYRSYWTQDFATH